MEKRRTCPKCKSQNVITERRIDGNSECKECNYKSKTDDFLLENIRFREWMREKEKGVYVGCIYNQSASDDLMNIIKKYNIPSTLTVDDFHTTIIYSRKYADIENLNDDMEDSEIVAYPKELHVFNTFDNKRALVIKLDCEYLENRHKELMKKYNLTYNYDEYIPNITLSYDIGEMSIPDIEEFPRFFRIQSEYKEELNLQKKYN